VQRVLDTKINPAVAMHGGKVMLLDVKDGTAYVELAAVARAAAWRRPR
jgi:Fe-S cluster biogenesis protein NfuA